MYAAIAYTSFQLTHITREDCAVQVEQAMAANRPKNILQHPHLRHLGELWHLSVSGQWHSWQCSQKLSGPFLRAVMQVFKQWWSTGRQKHS